MENNYVGRLFINVIKEDGKIFKKGDKYLRGSINGVNVVGFLSKDGTAFNLKEDTERKEAPKKKAVKRDEPF